MLKDPGFSKDSVRPFNEGPLMKASPAMEARKLMSPVVNTTEAVASELSAS